MLPNTNRMPGVARVEYFRIPPEINVARNIGRLMVNDIDWA